MLKTVQLLRSSFLIIITTIAQSLQFLRWSLSSRAGLSAEVLRFPSDPSYRFLIHDRDSIFSTEVDEELQAFGLKVLRTPVRAPKANAYCERLMGTIRRECLDYMIPLSEKHLRTILRAWVAHYNQGRPHSSLGPGIPERKTTPARRTHRHRLEPNERVISTAILGGLHHEYELEQTAA